MTGEALAMRRQLSQLANRHGTAPAQPRILPLTDVTDCPQRVIGVAVAPSIDLERTKFSSYAFALAGLDLPPLRYRHGTADVGHIESLKTDDRGRLIITAVIDDPDARRAPAFSVAAKVLAFEVRDADDRDGYHAVITRAEITEISLTDRPAHPDCLVMHRFRAHSAYSEFLDLAKRKFELLGEMVRLIGVRAQQPQEAATSDDPMPDAPRVARPMTDFQKLVQEINR